MKRAVVVGAHWGLVHVQALRQAGVEVQERSITFTDVLQADEVFSTGNYAKVQPCLQVEDRGYAIGPLYRKARELYWDFARASAGT